MEVRGVYASRDSRSLRYASICTRCAPIACGSHGSLTDDAYTAGSGSGSGAVAVAVALPCHAVHCNAMHGHAMPLAGHAVPMAAIRSHARVRHGCACGAPNTALVMPLRNPPPGAAAAARRANGTIASLYLHECVHTQPHTLQVRAHGAALQASDGTKCRTASPHDRAGRTVDGVLTGAQ